MNNSELEKLLKRAKVAEPRAEFWQELPGDVQRAIARGDTVRAGKIANAPSIVAIILKRVMPVVLAAVCVMVGFIWGVNSRQSDALQGRELAEARACWREVAALFPNQLQAIVFDPQGTRLVLSEKANQAGASPIYLKLCDGKTCERFVTFSGQQIKVNGEDFEVLVDHNGGILLIGDAKVWNSSSDGKSLGAYKVFAKSLANS